MGNEGNNGTGERPDGVQRITISYDPFARKADLDLGGLTYEDALAVMDRAYRELDARYRFNRARELAAEVMQAQSIADLVSRNPRGPRIQS